MRDDNPTVDSKILFVLPTADYAGLQHLGRQVALLRPARRRRDVSGTGRAVKVSFDRPIFEGNDERDRFFGPDFETLYWLEKQGYDVSYSDDVAVHQNPAPR